MIILLMSVGAEDTTIIKEGDKRMKIRVCEENKERIEQAIREAEGRATARTLTYADIVDGIARVEKELSIPKKHLVGISFTQDVNAEIFPAVYKHTPMSTWYTVEYGRTGWFLIAVDRKLTGSTDKQFTLYLTEDAKAAVIRRLKKF